MTTETMEDAARFSNFAQRVKMRYWNKKGVTKQASEKQLDDILLLAFDDLSLQLSTLVSKLEGEKINTEPLSGQTYVKSKGFNAGLTRSQEVIKELGKELNGKSN